MRKIIVLAMVLSACMDIVGQQAANFTVTDIAGKKHDLYTYLNAGNYVVLDMTGYN